MIDIAQLQEILLKNIIELDKDNAPIDKVAVLAKSCEVMISSVKVQLQYAAAKKELPSLEFLDTKDD
jgi:hypothetical protein